MFNSVITALQQHLDIGAKDKHTRASQIRQMVSKRPMMFVTVQYLKALLKVSQGANTNFCWYNEIPRRPSRRDHQPGLVFVSSLRMFKTETYAGPLCLLTATPFAANRDCTKSTFEHSLWHVHEYAVCRPKCLQVIRPAKLRAKLSGSPAISQTCIIFSQSRCVMQRKGSCFHLAIHT